MTTPISTEKPKDLDLARTNELIDAMKPYDVFETENELSHRMEVRIFSLF